MDLLFLKKCAMSLLPYWATEARRQRVRCHEKQAERYYHNMEESGPPGMLLCKTAPGSIIPVTTTLRRNEIGRLPIGLFISLNHELVHDHDIGIGYPL